MQCHIFANRAVLMALLAAAAGSPASACGIQTSGMQPGTALQMITSSGHDHPWLRISHPAIVSTKLVSGPCHGRLTQTNPLGFRYTTAPGFTGNDTFAFLGCTATGQCIMSGAVITVTR